MEKRQRRKKLPGNGFGLGNGRKESVEAVGVDTPQKAKPRDGPYLQMPGHTAAMGIAKMELRILFPLSRFRDGVCFLIFRFHLYAIYHRFCNLQPIGAFLAPNQKQ